MDKFEPFANNWPLDLALCEVQVIGRELFVFSCFDLRDGVMWDLESRPIIPIPLGSIVGYKYYTNLSGEMTFSAREMLEHLKIQAHEVEN